MSSTETMSGGALREREQAAGKRVIHPWPLRVMHWLNAVAITVSLLFWGWVWGGMGLLLAIPITATLRVICEHTDSLKPIGRWISA